MSSSSFVIHLFFLFPSLPNSRVAFFFLFSCRLHPVVDGFDQCENKALSGALHYEKLTKKNRNICLVVVEKKTIVVGHYLTKAVDAHPRLNTVYRPTKTKMKLFALVTTNDAIYQKSRFCQVEYYFDCTVKSVQENYSAAVKAAIAVRRSKCDAKEKVIKDRNAHLSFLSKISLLARKCMEYEGEVE